MKGVSGRPIPHKSWAALFFSLAIVIGSFFWPLLGLSVPLLLLAAVISNFVKPRWFCAKACPRAHTLGGFLPSLSRYRALPAFLYSGAVRTMLCAFVLVCAVGQTSRLRSNIPALGLFFWAVCVITLAAAVALGIFYKPRAWCALCPVGTLQDTLRRK